MLCRESSKGYQARVHWLQCPPRTRLAQSVASFGAALRLKVAYGMRQPAPPKAGRFALLACVALAWALGGCASVQFYAQAVSGQAALLLSRRDVQAIIDDSRTEPELAAQLRLATAMLRFAAEELALPVGERYASYADVGRVALWNVVAAHELQLAARPRCYPLVGCTVYRGYFSKRAAEAEQRRLAANDDVHVYPVGAYSTLGWFDDPILSSFVHYPEPALAELLFHELAHGVLYVRDDAAFNESFATFVGSRGAAAWVATHGGDADALRREHEAKREVSARFSAFLRQWRDRLQALYALPINAEAKRQLKAEAFAAMRSAYRACRQRLGNGRYDGYMRQPFNNARMVLAGTYDDLREGFSRLFDAAGSWPAFYDRVREIGALPPAERRRQLLPVAATPPTFACAA